MKNLGTFIVILIFIAGVWLIYDNWSLIKSDFFHNYGEVPNFKLYDYLGRPHLRSEFSGYPLVINSLAADTPFSGEELQAFATMQSELGEKNVILAINRGEPLSLAKNFTDRIGVTGSLIFLVDPGDTFYKAIGGYTMPETLFVDKEGEGKFRYSANENDLCDLIH